MLELFGHVASLHDGRRIDRHPIDQSTFDSKLVRVRQLLFAALGVEVYGRRCHQQ